MSVRVRYAPSPTGLQHIGGVRTALFNYFFARASGGTFILRVEDTDRERSTPESIQDLYDTFNWLGINWDEGPDKGGDYGPYIQSERQELYRSHAQKLVDEGKAYYCYCSSGRLDKIRQEQADRQDSRQGYDRRCRDLTEDQRKELAAEAAAEGRNPVIRFKIPLEGATSFHDEIMGDIERRNEDINPDPVMLKADGFPTYHLANVIDDHNMKITHIMRAQEWIPSGPLHVLLYDAFGWTPPRYCHLPMVLGSDGKKLSKRHGSTSVIEFRKAGYLPEALINCVTLVGWSYDDSRELFTLKELEELFTLDKLNKAPGVFDYTKLEWFNGHYIREKSDKELCDLVTPYLQKEGYVADPVPSDVQDFLLELMPLVKERLKVLSDITQVAGFFFNAPETFDLKDLIPKKMDLDGVIKVLKDHLELVQGFEGRNDEENEALYRKYAADEEIKLGQVLMPLRVALSGTRVSPPMFETMRVMGTGEVEKRLKTALQFAEAQKTQQ